MNNSNDSLKDVGALVLGAITGAVLGVLFAPHKGSKTRNRIMGGAKDMANDFSQMVKDEVDAFRNKAEEAVGYVDEKGIELKHNLNQKAETLKSVL